MCLNHAIKKMFPFFISLPKLQKLKKIFKITFVAIISLVFTSSYGQKKVINVPPNKSVELDFKEFTSYEAKVANKSKVDLEIKVVDKESLKQVSGFGLGKKKTEEVMLKNSSKLVIKNVGDDIATVVVKTKAIEIMKIDTNPSYVSFTLRNNSPKSIPLIIPNVMNPNLSPFSNSGVDLKIGQEIIFKNKGRKYVLLTISSDIKDGDVIMVNELLKERKKVLGL